MRIVAGRLRGRRLTAPAGRSTRPTSDRVREALFSMLGPIEGALVLDLFAGTGALGIEALSRGAGSAVFVERDRAALTALRENLRTLSLTPPEVEVRGGDALAATERAFAAGERYDLVFLDPPYALAATLAPKLSERLPELLCGGGRVIVESDRRAPLELALPLLRERRYGDTTIRIHARAEP
jgi:16S rRNA (guanine966-N2)-methyltransferase